MSSPRGAPAAAGAADLDSWDCTLLGPPSRNNFGSADLSPSGLLAFTAGSSISVVDSRSLQLISTIPLPSPNPSNSISLSPFVTSVRWTPLPLRRDLLSMEPSSSHLLLVAADRQGRICILDFRARSPLLWFETDSASKPDIQDLCWVQARPDSCLLAAINGPSTLSLYSASSACCLFQYDAAPEFLSCLRRGDDIGTGLGSSSGDTFSNAVKKASNKAQIKDGTSVQELQSDRSIREKKPRVLGDEGPSMTELSGYNFKRQEFEIEYDNDAELVLADMEFKDTDSDTDHELKLRVLRIYSKRLDERKRRKDFILERNLLYPDPFEKSFSPEEREICQRYRVLMRFHLKEEHDKLLKNIIEEQRIVKRIQDLQEARAAGCCTAAEANRFIEQKRKKEAEESEHGVKESAQGPNGKVLQRQNHLKGEFDASPQGFVKGSTGLQPSSRDSSSALQTISSCVDEWDITGFAGADLLSETEKGLCGEIRILPSHYLNMLQVMSVEILKGNVTNKSDAHSLFKVEASKVDKVYDMLVEKGIAQAS